ncbi:MAG: hypothetical protein ACRDFB_05050, partial [Rhabdochlamydiaceae bacterium]
MVQLKTYVIGSPTDNMTVTITSTLGGTSLGSTSIACSALASDAYTPFNFSTPIAVIEGNTYYIQMSRSGSRDTSNYPNVYLNSGTQIYREPIYINNSGIWTPATVGSFNFGAFFYNTASVPFYWSNISLDVSNGHSFIPVNDTQPFASVTLANLLHLSNGFDDYQTFNGGSFTSYPQAPKMRTIVPFQSRIYGANVPGEGSLEFFSTTAFEQITAENSYFTNAPLAGVTSIDINDPIFGGLSLATPSLTGLYIQATLGVGTANEETAIVTGIAATVSGSIVNSPYTVTLKNATANSHSTDDVVQNTDKWYQDTNFSTAAGQFPVDPDHQGRIIANDVIGGNLVMHKSAGGL